VNLLVICHGENFQCYPFLWHFLTCVNRCIATLAGNFPFALGAATFGNIVYEDRLLNISSDKPASAFDCCSCRFFLFYLCRLMVRWAIDFLGKCAFSLLVTVQAAVVALYQFYRLNLKVCKLFAEMKVAGTHYCCE
jgi:hypothetical protein